VAGERGLYEAVYDTAHTGVFRFQAIAKTGDEELGRAQFAVRREDGVIEHYHVQQNRALLERPKVVGVRAQLRRIEDTTFITRRSVVTNLAAALAAGLNVTVLAEARHYPHVAAVLATLPPGPVTINHLALPFPEVDRVAWRIALRDFARRPGTYVQLSGLPFLFQARWRDVDARSVLDDALDILGPRRMLFASDYPMLLRFATYGEWVQYVDEYLAARRLTADESAAVMAGNAREANPRLEVPRTATARVAF